MDNGIDPDKHEFLIAKPVPLAKRQRVGSVGAAAEKKEEATTAEKVDDADGDEAEPDDDEAEAVLVDNDEIEEVDLVDEEDDDELVVKHDDEDEGDEVVDEVGEVDDVNEVPDFEEENDEPTVVSLETSNVIDNEDSLNLTIGEDEEKIFQDEVIFFFPIFIVTSKYVLKQSVVMLLFVKR